MPVWSIGANMIGPEDGLGFIETRFLRDVIFNGAFAGSHEAAIGSIDIDWFRERIKGTIIESVGRAALLRQIHIACTNDTRVVQPLRDRSAAWLLVN